MDSQDWKVLAHLHMDMNDDDENKFACDAERVDIYGIGKACCQLCIQ
jgi:hypothetical protein